MPLPEGFKVGGVAVTPRLAPPAVQKTIRILDSLPAKTLETTASLSSLVGITIGRWPQHPVLEGYRHLIDGKLFWGNRATILELKKSLGVIDAKS